MTPCYTFFKYVEQTNNFSFLFLSVLVNNQPPSTHLPRSDILTKLQSSLIIICLSYKNQKIFFNAAEDSTNLGGHQLR